MENSTTEPKLKRPSLVELILERLRGEILSGRYEPGSSLPPERELAERYGVNRTSVKHALMKLESVGLIDIRHGIGSLVVDWAERGGAGLLDHLAFGAGDQKLLADILELRVYVGGAIAAVAAERADAAADERILAIATALDQARSTSEVQELELAFFRELASATGNVAFKLIMNTVSASYLPDRALLVHAFEDGAAVKKALRGIQKAVARRDAAKARAAAEQYLSGNGARMLAGLGASKGGA